MIRHVRVSHLLMSSCEFRSHCDFML